MNGHKKIRLIPSITQMIFLKLNDVMFVGHSNHMVVNDIYVRGWGTYNWCIIELSFYSLFFLSTNRDKARDIILKL